MNAETRQSVSGRVSALLVTIEARACQTGCWRVVSTIDADPQRGVATDGLPSRQHPVWHALLHWWAILMGRQIEGQDLATG